MDHTMITWEAQIAPAGDGRWRADLFPFGSDETERFRYIRGTREDAIAYVRQIWHFATLYEVVPCDECGEGSTEDDDEYCARCDNERELQVYIKDD